METTNRQAGVEYNTVFTTTTNEREQQQHKYKEKDRQTYIQNYRAERERESVPGNLLDECECENSEHSGEQTDKNIKILSHVPSCLLTSVLFLGKRIVIKFGIVLECIHHISTAD